jgi:hypothetical protein
VLYVVLEGKLAFPMRLQACLERKLPQLKGGTQFKFGEQMKMRLPFAWNPLEPNLFNNGPDALMRLAEREAGRMRRDFGTDLVLIVLDTMGLAAVYENEDRASQVQTVISHLNKVSDTTGALIVGVDHYGKDQGAGLRGSSAKRGHNETILAHIAERAKTVR